MSKAETLRDGLEEILSLPLIRLTVSNPRGGEYKKITGRPMEVRGKTVLQLEKFTETQQYKDIEAYWNKDVESFKKKSAKYYLYK